MADDTKSLKKLKILREKVDWMNGKARYNFFRDFIELIDNWEDELPNLRDIFQGQEINCLLSFDVTIHNRYYNRRTPIIEFVLKTGYKDEPVLDKDGKPLLHCNTALHQQLGDSEIANDLFKIYNRFDVNYIDGDGYTHFHAACEYGCYDVVEKFLELGQNPNFPVQKSVHPPLHLAAFNQHMNVFELLLKHGADKNSRDRSGQTILSVTLQWGELKEWAQLLFDINKEQTVEVVDVPDDRGRTPLQMAVARFLPHLVDLLLDNGADLSSFAFLTKDDFDRCFESILHELYPPAAKMKKLSAVLKTVECLEKRGYKLNRSDALIIMSLLIEHKMYKKELYGFYRCWNDRSGIMKEAKKIMITPKLSAYHLTRLSPYEVEKCLTNTDYLKLVPVIQKIWNDHVKLGKACGAPLLELMARRFFQRWASESLMELTNYQLPILCCEKIVAHLINLECRRVCRAAEIDA